MNTKNRALLWEETRVGGAIALATLLGGLVGMLPFLDSYHKATDEILILFPTLGFSLLAALLLTLNTANSGHLMGGFSRRILRLPVDIWSTVLIILLSRLAAVLVVSGLLAAVSWGLFGSGPGADTVLLLGMAYLLFQVLDWLRAPAAPLVVVIIGALLLVLLMHVSGFKPVPGGMLDASHLLLAFPPALGLAYAASLAAVGYTRRGAKLALPARLVPKAKTGVGGGKRRKPFSTPAAAQYWFERRHAGIFLLVATVVCGMLIVGLFSLIRPRPMDAPTSAYFTEVVPFLAFIGAAIAWHLRSERTQFWRHSRPASYFLRLPVEPVDLVRARIATSVSTFTAVWLLVALVIRWTFLAPMFSRLIQDALANGEITGREVMALVISVPLLLGLLGWIAAHVPWKLVALEVLLGFLIVVFDNARISYALGCLMLALPLFWFLKELVRARVKGLLPAWSLFACALLWVVIAFAIFPYGFLQLRPIPIILCLSTASFAALVVLPFPNLLLAAPGHLVGERSGHAQTFRPGTGYTPRRAVGLCALFVVFAAIAWVRSTPEPTFRARLRAEGIPTTFAELEASYKPVPATSNVALHYMAVADKLQRLHEEWASRQGSHRVPAQGKPRNDSNGALLVLDTARIGGTEPIPQADWEATSEYWRHVGKPVTDELRAITQSGLHQSRYPIDASGIYAIDSPHNAALMDLTFQLRLKALVAALEEQPERVVEALTDMLALAKSLKGEPTMSGQYTRMHIYINLERLLEDVMNRETFSEETLRRFQATLQDALPSGTDLGLSEQIMTQAMVPTLRDIEAHTYAALLFDARSDEALTPINRLKENGLAPVLELLGWLPTNYVLATRNLFALKDEFVRYRYQGYASEGDLRHTLNPVEVLFFAPTQYAFHMPIYALLEDWQAETFLSVAKAGTALERYRIANGRLPETLEQLVPAFIERVPSDPFNDGKPLTFRVQEGDGYQVYSFGPNCEDDQGSTDWKDITFTVNPVELRVRPQILAADATV